MGSDSQPDPAPSTPAPSTPAPSTSRAAGELVRQLTGDLPCVRCSYNLRGLSVLGRCPECGLAVRAAVLAAVDPYATVLRPIPHRRLTAGGLVLWAAGALGAALLTWSVRAQEMVDSSGVVGVSGWWTLHVAILCILLSGLGAVALVHPHAGIGAWQIAGAGAAVAAYVPLGYLYWRLHGIFDAGGVHPYLRLGGALSERNLLRLAIGALEALIVLGLRPNARLLVGRSILLREGRVDRQTMFALVAAVGLAALGDSLHLVSDHFGPDRGSTVLMAGTILIAVGSMLFTVGLAGALVDSWRIGRAILEPAPSYRQIMGPPAGRGGAGDRGAHDVGGEGAGGVGGVGGT